VVLIFSVSLPKCPNEECNEELTSEDGANVSIVRYSAQQGVCNITIVPQE